MRRITIILAATGKQIMLHLVVATIAIAVLRKLTNTTVGEMAAGHTGATTIMYQECNELTLINNSSINTRSLFIISTTRQLPMT